MKTNKSTSVELKSRTTLAVEEAPPIRRRNAEATRQAILMSARAAFARAGYDGAGVREIASGAGVTAMLVNRYFGSKEKLFAEVVADTMASTAVVMPVIMNAASSGEDIAAALVHITQAGATPLDGFQIMLHSASSKRAAEIGRQQIEKYHHAAITKALGGELAPQRAALMLSLISGFQVMRQMMALSALAEAEPETLVKMLGGLFQLLIDGGLGGERSLVKASKVTASKH